MDQVHEKELAESDGNTQLDLEIKAFTELLVDIYEYRQAQKKKKENESPDPKNQESIE